MKCFSPYLFLLFVLPLPLAGQMNEKRGLAEQNHLVFHASYSPSGEYIATTGSDNNIIIWNAETGIIHRTLSGLRKRPNRVVFSADGQRIYTAGEDGLITTWDVGLVRMNSQTGGHSGAIKAMAINREGTRLVTGGEDGVLRAWKLEGGEPELLFELKGHRKTIYTADFSPDGNHAVSGGADRNLILWDMNQGRMVHEKKAHQGYVRCARFSPGGGQLASGGDDKVIRIWDSENLEEIRILEGHRSWVQTLSYTRSGQRIISGAHDGTIRIWDAGSGTQLAVSEKLDNVVLSVDVDPRHPDFISSCLMSETVRIWAYDPVDQRIATETEVVQPPQGQADPGASPDSGAPEVPVINVFSPMTENGRATHSRASLMVVGKAEARDGIQTIIVNSQRAALNDEGVFEAEIPLVHGENKVEIMAVSRTGKMGSGSLTVHCTDESATAPPVRENEWEQGRYYALIIGIDQYEDEQIQDLDFPIQDAGTLVETLVEKYRFSSEDITFLKNPSRTEIIIALDDLSRKVTPDDNLLIFYAGHGIWDEQTGIGYWLPRDAAQSNTANWFRNSTLRDFIGGIRSRHTLLIADACFSGSIFKTRGGFSAPEQGVRKLYELQSRKAMTSGALKEVPDESVFVRYLIRELQENQSAYLPSEVLFGNFKSVVLNNSPNVPQYGTIQNVGDEGGDFIFIRK